MTGKLVEILTGSAAPREMGTLALGYALTILVVQGNRYFKRFYVRRFANNVSRRMKQVLYAKPYENPVKREDYPGFVWQGAAS